MTRIQRFATLALAMGLAPATFGGAMAQTATNPLLAPWTGGYGGVPNWEAGTPETYKPALLSGIETRAKEIDAIATSMDKPMFDDVIVAMERCGRDLDRDERMLAVINVVTRISA